MKKNVNVEHEEDRHKKKREEEDDVKENTQCTTQPEAP